MLSSSESIEKRGIQREPGRSIRVNRQVMAQLGAIFVAAPSYLWLLGLLVSPSQANEPLLAHSFAFQAHYALGFRP